MKPAARVLFIGQDSADASLLDLVFAREDPDVEVAHLTDAVGFGRELERDDFDLVVCDERFDWGSAASVLAEVRARRPHVTVVVLTEAATWLGAEPSPEARDAALAKSSAAFLALPALLRASRERAAARDDASRLEPRLRGILEQSDVGVFRLTLDGRLLEADETFLRLVGAPSLEAAKGLSFASLTPRLPRGFTESGKVYRHREWLRGYRDQEFRASLVQVVASDDDGQPVLDGLLEELAERRDADAGPRLEGSRLERANEELRRFASMTAHELREPLRTIEQSTRMLIEDLGGALHGDAEGSANQVIQGVRRLESMIEGLLTLARLGGTESETRPCDCNTVVEDVLGGLRARIEETGARVRVGALPTVRADPTQLRLLFRNLIGNALKFHGPATPEVRVAARQQDDQWVFSVEDHGPGVRPEQHERIFERFTRGGAGPGAGLGLAICEEGAERLGGRRWGESEPPRGSIFYFTIPLSVSGETGLGDQDDEAPADGSDRSARGEAG